MKRKIDLNTWNRKEHYHFFRSFDEPYYGITVQVDHTELYRKAKAENVSFYLAYLHCFLAAVNNSEPFRIRIIEGEPYMFERIHLSATVDRPDGTFGFSYIDIIPTS
jgi:chloramphenicol O-acetyltransferase type A